MSRLNHKGPMGQGAMTGCRLGRCTNFGADLKNQKTSVNANPNNDLNDNLPTRGFGFGRDRGFGSRRGQGGFGRGTGRQNRY